MSNRSTTNTNPKVSHPVAFSVREKLGAKTIPFKICLADIDTLRSCLLRLAAVESFYFERTDHNNKQYIKRVLVPCEYELLEDALRAYKFLVELSCGRTDYLAEVYVPVSQDLLFFMDGLIRAFYVVANMREGSQAVISYTTPYLHTKVLQAIRDDRWYECVELIFDMSSAHEPNLPVIGEIFRVGPDSGTCVGIRGRYYTMRIIK